LPLSLSGSSFPSLISFFSLSIGLPFAMVGCSAGFIDWHLDPRYRNVRPGAHVCDSLRRWR
jgi:hypothetical protein